MRSCALHGSCGLDLQVQSNNERERQMTLDSEQDRAVVCAACSTVEGCEKHQLFTCSSCGKLTSWSDGSADERPMDCSECWCRHVHGSSVGEVGLKCATASVVLRSNGAPGSKVAGASKKKPPTKTEIAHDLGAKINVHLRRFERDPEINPGKRYDKETKAYVPDERGSRDYYGARAFGARHRVLVTYVTYQGSHYLTIEKALKYLAWLNAGNVGTHYEITK